MADDTRRLTRCLTYIKENITQVEKILDILIEDEIIGLDERSQILTKLPLVNQIHELIETVIRKQAHQSFLEALKKTGNSHVFDKITGCTFQKDEKNLSRDNTSASQLTDEDENVENSEKDQYLKEKTWEELKIENDRLKSQQSFVREQLNEKYRKIQELKLEIGNCKRQNTDLNDKTEAFERLQGRLQDIEVGLSEIEKSNTSNMIEMALSERSKEIYVLQRECEDLKTENEEKSEQIANLNIQMKRLKTELQKASKDRQRLEGKFEDMSNKIDDKFSDMMAALNDLKDIYNRPAQCEVTTPRNASSFRSQFGRKVPFMVPKQKAYITQLTRIKR